jgi:hypothetical protein
VVAGFLVAIKQLMPDQEITAFFVLKFRAKVCALRTRIAYQNLTVGTVRHRYFLEQLNLFPALVLFIFVCARLHVEFSLRFRY